MQDATWQDRTGPKQYLSKFYYLVFDVMKDLLEKCHTAALSMDIYGWTPMHHLFELKARIDELVVQLLIQYCMIRKY